MNTIPRFTPQTSFDGLSDHAAIAAENAWLRATVERLSAPISDEEWGECDIPDFKDFDNLHRKLANGIIASRLAPPQPAEPQ